MGLTSSSVGMHTARQELAIRKRAPSDCVVALAGNPNVGKSTVFNTLTNLRQHTGNWPGKTVENAQGYCRGQQHGYVLVDIPGTYSLMAHSAEEEVARNFLCFEHPDAVVVVCDATCLERNLNLVLQTLEITGNVVVCVNLMDEAKRKGILIDLRALEKQLGVPVIGTVARSKRSLTQLTRALDQMTAQPKKSSLHLVNYGEVLEKAIATVEPAVRASAFSQLDSRWVSLRLLEKDTLLMGELETRFGSAAMNDEQLKAAVSCAQEELRAQGVDVEGLRDRIVSALVNAAETLCRQGVVAQTGTYGSRDRRFDRILTGKWTGFPIMLLLLLFIFYLTITGANYPSELISKGLFSLEDDLTGLLVAVGAPEWLQGLLVLGMYRVLSWVVSVMLPPMAIFFPLFTLLEDSGYLPRIAYNLDKPFKRCSACGKQALTMCMGFGCNAAGVIGCRIIDSRRERLLAILTNNFVPCNGRFPTLIALLTMFFAVSAGVFSSVASAALLTLLITLGVLVTFLSTRLLSKTLLKGEPSSFTLEMPSFRRPQVGRVIVRSIFDRTLFVLGRAAAIAAPAGMLIWLMANVQVGGQSLLNLSAGFLDPFARLLGLDGVILIAFILGFPANEIVIPIIIMAYMAQGSLLTLDSLEQMKALFVAHGWTPVTALCTMLFSLMHWPCSTTLLTIKKETGSVKWTALAAALPTGFGLLACFLVASIGRLFGQ